MRPMVSSGYANGGYIPVEIGEAFWRIEASLATLTWAQGDDIKATLQALGRAGASFYCYDPRRAFPASDPTGSEASGQIVTINSVSGGRLVSLTGLPAAYRITAGDLMTFTYGSSPARRQMVRAVETCSSPSPCSS